MPARTRVSNSSRCNSGAIRITGNQCPLWERDAGKIRISTGDGVFRVFYVTQFGDEIYVLHCFTKKTQRTSKKDIDTGERRYKEAKRMHEQRKGRTP
jgi:phage-related protein